ncbi:MAG: hypothetical protein JNL92_18660 [Opitutaceae bacterium]|nr:hypothetical protein [Opitutaceae bacterium]
MSRSPCRAEGPRWRAALGLALAWVTPLAAELKVGWAQADLTPPEPVIIAGQFHARVSEGVLDPITTTVLALEGDGDHVVFVSCDVVSIPDALRDAVRARLRSAGGLDPRKVILHATHSHTAPLYDAGRIVPGLDLRVMETGALVTLTADRIAQAVTRAWTERTPGGIAYGLGQAVVGRNRRSVDRRGKSTMYGDVARPDFSHIEGFEDHDVNFLATYDPQGALTGLVVNLACPAQADESLFQLTADFWHDTRVELRRRHGARLFVAAQCSTAGDIAPHFVRNSSYDHRASKRMLELKQRSVRAEIAQRIARAADDVLPVIKSTVDRSPRLRHRVETLALPMNHLTEADVADARQEAGVWRGRYEAERKKLETQPAAARTGRWYVAITGAYGRMRWNERVLERFEAQRNGPQAQTIEFHVLRVGDVAFATNPFEYYLDYGIQIKARSPAPQTFLLQLAGAGTYVPSPRSTLGGGYGSLPASNPVGAQGGGVLRDRTVELIREYWK